MKTKYKWFVFLLALFGVFLQFNAWPWTATLLYTNSPFSITPFIPPALTNGQSYDVHVVFTPTNAGLFTNYVIFTFSNGVAFSTNMVTGEGIVPPPTPTAIRILPR
jgi:hypothetical protein